MRHRCLPVLLTMVLLPVEVGLAAEPPATCKLELVRLEPLLPGKSWPENERLVRFARGLSFYFHKEAKPKANPAVDKDREQVEKDFREIVRKEPEKYQAEYPHRDVVTLGGRKYGFVLDKQSEKSQGYDRLYFDRNGNGDLTDDAPIDVPEKNKTPESVESEGGWVTASYALPRVDLRIHNEGTAWDYSFFVATYTSIHEKDLSLRARLMPAAYRQGEIVLEGKRRKISLIDWSVNGRFDVPVQFASDGKGFEDYFSQYGTEILFDPDFLLLGYVSEHRQFLAKMNALGGKLYKIHVRPGGDELTCTPVAVPTGKIAAPSAPCNVWLINEQGCLALDLQKDTPAEIPAGEWRLMDCVFLYGAEEQKATDEERAKAKLSGESAREAAKDAVPSKDVASPSAKIRYLAANCGKDCEPVTVVAGKTTVLKIGPPYVPTLTVEAKEGAAMLGLAILGVGHDKVYALSGDSPPKPKFTITDPQGKVVAQGNFEYG